MGMCVCKATVCVNACVHVCAVHCMLCCVHIARISSSSTYKYISVNIGVCLFVHDMEIPSFQLARSLTFYFNHFPCKHNEEWKKKRNETHGSNNMHSAYVQEVMHWPSFTHTPCKAISAYDRKNCVELLICHGMIFTVSCIP